MLRPLNIEVTRDIVTAEDSGSFCLSINATESTTVSDCNCLTQVFGYMRVGKNEHPAPRGASGCKCNLEKD